MSILDFTRREFLRRLSAAGVSLPVIGSASADAQVPKQPQNVRIATEGSGAGKRVLTAADFRFIGGMRIPPTVQGMDTTWGRGLTHRYVNGQLRFLASAGNQVFEITPAWAPSGPFPYASLVRVWGDVSREKRYTDQYGPNSGDTYGLYWDEQDKRLYWNYGNGYNSIGPNDPSVGYSVLNDATGASTPVGAWRFTGRGCKATQCGVLPIPDWFSAAYCPGRRLGAGFGGYFSVANSGPVSMGPALAAFVPPNISTTPDRTSVVYTNLVGYPFNTSAYTLPTRCQRDTNYWSDFDGWNPKDGVGYWSWSDWLWQSAIWIDQPDKHGVVYFPVLGNGRTWYERSTLHAQNASHWWYVYDPLTLGQVAKGERGQDQIQPAQRWAGQFPGITYPMVGWSDEPHHVVCGATYDAISKRAYIAVRWGAKTGEMPSSCTAVFAYEVV